MSRPKIEDVAFAIVIETIAELERRFFYRIPDEIKRGVALEVITPERFNRLLVQEPEACSPSSSDGLLQD